MAPSSRPVETRPDWAGCGFDATGDLHCGDGRQGRFFSLDAPAPAPAPALTATAAAAAADRRVACVPAQTFSRPAPEYVPIWYVTPR
jgi:hypothetical protein